MSDIHTHQAFGLTIAAELPLPELMPAAPEAVPDVRITFGSTPESLETPTAHGVLYQIEHNTLLMNIPRVARFQVRAGCEILIEPHGAGEPADIRAFLLGHVMGGLLIQRELLPLHASSVVTPAGAAIFVGNSGDGKSTIAAALHERGYPVFGDDICALQIEPQAPALVWPGIPMLKLWPDSFKQIDRPIDDRPRVRPSTEKYYFAPERAEYAPQPVLAIYQLTDTNTDELSLQEIKGFEKIQTLSTNTYRRRFLQGMGATPRHFRQVNLLSGSTRVVRVVRPRGSFRLNELADLIEQDFGV
jgi:hypothetical protein